MTPLTPTHRNQTSLNVRFQIQRLTCFFLVIFTFMNLFFSLSVRAEIGVLPTENDTSKPLTSRWFIETIKPGESVTRSVTISNSTSSEIQLQAKDAIQTTDGAFTFKENEDENTEAGNWIKLAQNSVNLQSNQPQKVEFTITVPPDTKPGEYAAVISGQEVKKNKNNQTLDVVTRIGSRVYITVPGQLTTQNSIDGFVFLSPKSPNYQAFLTARLRQPFDDLFLEMNFKNEGNIFTKSKGQLSIKGADFETTIDFDRDLAPLQTPAYFLISATKDTSSLKIKPGKYTATLKFENTPVINYNKESIQDSSKTREYTTEIEYTQEILDQMKIDFENLTTQQKIQEKGAQDAGSKLEIIDLAKEEPEPKTDNTLLYVVIILGILCLMLAVGAAFLYIRNRNLLVKKMKETEIESV